MYVVCNVVVEKLIEHRPKQKCKVTHCQKIDTNAGLLDICLG